MVIIRVFCKHIISLCTIIKKEIFSSVHNNNCNYGTWVSVVLLFWVPNKEDLDFYQDVSVLQSEVSSGQPYRNYPRVDFQVQTSERKRMNFLVG